MCGPSGIGKTSIIDILAKDMLGVKVNEALFFSHSCDERGIQVMREKLHDFVPKKVSLPDGIPKLLVFEMADNLSEGVQQLMRRLMEQHSYHCLFIIMCSDINSLIEALQSRCCILRFDNLDYTNQRIVLEKISEAEGIQIDEEAMGVLSQLSKGDLRYSINNLQICSLISKNVNADLIRQMCVFPYYKMFINILDYIKVGDLSKSLIEINNLYSQGLNGIDIILLLGDMIIISDVDPTFKIRVIKELCIAHSRVINSCDSKIILYNLISRLIVNIKKIE
jgi:replication factor C subunit 2/4